MTARRSLGVRRVTVVQHRPCVFADSLTWPPDPVERLRVSLSRLVHPPLSLSLDAVDGLLCDPYGVVLRVAPSL